MSNNQSVSGAMEFYRGEMEKRPEYKKVSPSVAWLVIILTAALATAFFYGIGRLFFWDKYNTAPFYEQQFEALKERAEAEPENVENLVNLGWAYFQKGDLNQALLSFDKATTLDEQYFPAFFNKGLTYLQMEKFDLAIRAFQHAVQLAPRDHVSQMNLGIAYAGANEPDKAVEALSKAYLLRPGTVEILLRLGDIYAKTGQSDKAREKYLEAMRFDPKNADADAALQKLGQ